MMKKSEQVLEVILIKSHLSDVTLSLVIYFFTWLYVWLLSLPLSTLSISSNYKTWLIPNALILLLSEECELVFKT